MVHSVPAIELHSSGISAGCCLGSHDFICFCVWQGGGGRDAKAKIGGLVLEAVSAVAKEDAAGLWILGLQTYRSLGIPRLGLLDQLKLFLASSRKGPLRVRRTSSLGAV